MRKIVYSTGEGTVAVVTPFRNTYPEPEDLTDEEVEKRAWDKLPDDAIDPRFVDEADVPSDRTFRAAWEPDLSVNMDKARDIWRDKMRAARAPLLAALDVEYQRADEAIDADAKAGVAARKQMLRDVTDDAAIEAAETPEDLMNVWPEVLG